MCDRARSPASTPLGVGKFRHPRCAVQANPASHGLPHTLPTPPERWTLTPDAMSFTELVEEGPWGGCLG